MSMVNICGAADELQEFRRNISFLSIQDEITEEEDNNEEDQLETDD